MALLDVQAYNLPEALPEEKENLEAARLRSQHARKLMEKALPFKKRRFGNAVYTTTKAVHARTSGYWDRYWLERDGKAADEPIRVVTDSVVEHSTGRQRYQPVTIAAFGADGEITDLYYDLSESQKPAFLDSTFETIDFITRQQKQEAIRRFAGNLATHG